MPQAPTSNQPLSGPALAYALLSDAMNKQEDSRWAGHLHKALTAGSLAYGGWKFFKKYNDQRIAKTQYQVSILGSDPLYESAMVWLYTEFPPEAKRALLAFTGRLSDDGDLDSPIASNGSRSRKAAKFAYNGSMTQHIMIDGYKINVEVIGHGQGKDLLMSRYNELQFTCPSLEAREALSKQLDFLVKDESEGPPNLYIPRWGGWNRVDRQMVRTLDSVVLPGDQKQKMVTSLERFFASEEKYVGLGIPFHIGFLLSGPAGTGKTSFAQALAAYFKMDTYYLPLADLDRDTELNNLLSGIPPMSLLLLEDIDSLNSIHDRDTSDTSAEGGDKMSLSAVLNLLDGALTPYGLVTIATTNRLDVLDHALTRPGRFDIRETLDYVTPDQVRGLFEMAYDEVVFDPGPIHENISPADVVEILKNNFDDPQGAINDYVGKFGVSTNV